MVTWSPQAARFARTVCLLVCLVSCPVLGQDPATPPAPAAGERTRTCAEDRSLRLHRRKNPHLRRRPSPRLRRARTGAAAKPEPAPAAKPEPSSPADAAAKTEPAAPATPPAEQPKVPAAPPVVLPPFDYSRLAHPAVADQLELTTEQRAAAAQLINERAVALAAAPADKRAEVLAAADQKLAALLNEGQRAKLATMAETQKLRFNFRFQKWDDVLDWFARQAGMALVMDQPPTGPFTYSDNREYTPTEAIDLLNSVLLTKGFTLIQRGRMLILVDLSNKALPRNLIPRVTPEELAQRGNFEMVTVLFPLGTPARGGSGQGD